jgi:hypothetical protein
VVCGGECRVIGFGSGKVFFRILFRSVVHFLQTASQPQKKSRLFSDNLAYDLTGAGAGIKIDKDDLLPGAKSEFAINDWDDQ